ncbi:hypothetical protein [Kitasatospora sp. HPMI-4]|uniref:hypothetical protein n=1 Tax=Kitasatospora sp. HPMI-4 TaxID=3448443 RepID=UPI003F1A35B4
MRNISRTTSIAIAAVLAASAGLTAAPAQAASAGITVPLAHYSHMLVDAAHQHLFISSGSGYGSILVTDFSGQTVTTIANESGATGLALAPDGSTVYAALADGDAVSAIDTTTLAETARYATGAGTHPESVAYTAGKIWFGYGAAGKGGIGSIDPGADPAAVTLAAAPGFWYSAPLLAANPNGELVAGLPGMSPIQLASYDVSSGSATALVAPKSVMSASNLVDLQITPDGSSVVTASGYPYSQQVYKVSDLTQTGQYNSSNYPNSVSITADGTVLGGVYNPNSSSSVYVFAPGGSSPLKSFGFASGTLAPAGLAVTPDGAELFAVTSAPTGANPVLNIMPNPEQTASSLSLTGPADADPGSAITLTGSLGGTSPYTGGQTVHVTRVDSDDPSGVSLPDVTTAADGSFSITDAPCGTGTVTYQVSYAGDVQLTASTATATVTVGK